MGGIVAELLVNGPTTSMQRKPGRSGSSPYCTRDSLKIDSDAGAEFR